MSSEKKFSLLRGMLRTLGLSQEAADDVVNWITDLLGGDSGGDVARSPEFPYHLRDNFLSPAELSFLGVLRTTVNGRAVICSKVGLGDLFWVKSDDQSRFRIYTNKIDRKHVDFLVCDVATMRPLVGIELDDKSHQREDRRERDEFVNKVFQAAGLPLIHIQAKRAYSTTELGAMLAPHLGGKVESVAASAPTAQPVTIQSESPHCPKCGTAMVLRTAKSGANAGSQFWGCSNYPTCRSMQPYKG
ncbi:MAG: DUF2726 domain-containing protein [Chloroflexi bacterium]|nr:DUF2726 domain-containing protein [Chloroflexota bacterium]